MNTKNTQRSSGSPKPKKRSQTRPKKKRQYRIRNWHDYNTALVQRGSLTLWLGKDVLQEWRNQQRTGKRGKPRLYSDQAITCALRLREVYRLPLRATEGLLRSLIALVGADVTVPCYSTLSRRQAGLAVALEAPASAEPLHLVVDGTGLKVFGDGEWKARQHGVSKRRVWRKVHLAVDQNTGHVQAAATTTNSISDGTASVTGRCCLCYWNKWSSQSARSLPMAAMIGAVATKPLPSAGPKPPSRRAVGPRFGSMATARRSASPVTRTCGASVR